MASNGWKMATVPPAFARMWREHSPSVEPPKAYRRGELTAFVGREPLADDDWRWHISLRYGDPGSNGRIPTWEELVCAAHDLRPGVVFVIGVPPRSWWMNVHPHVLHLHETRDEPLIEQFRVNAQDQVPT
jgi:hypothetical protein